MKKIQILFLAIGMVGSLAAMESKQKKEKIEVETQKLAITTKPKTEKSLQELCISLLIFNAKRAKALTLDHYHVLNLSGLNNSITITDPMRTIKKLVEAEKMIMGEKKTYKLLENVPLNNKFILTHLILSHNAIPKLSDEIGQLTTLKRLHLESNKLETVPVNIGNLTKLQVLHLENNPLIFLPQEAIEKLKKTWFYFSQRSDKTLEIVGSVLLVAEWLSFKIQ